MLQLTQCNWFSSSLHPLSIAFKQVLLVITDSSADLLISWVLVRFLGLVASFSQGTCVLDAYHGTMYLLCSPCYNLPWSQSVWISPCPRRSHPSVWCVISLRFLKWSRLDILAVVPFPMSQIGISEVNQPCDDCVGSEWRVLYFEHTTSY